MNQLLQIALNDLPPLPKTALELREYVDNTKEIKISEVEKIIKSDPLVFMELLKLVNSAYYSFQNTINSVSHAISLLGVVNVKNIILVNALRSSFKIDTRPYGQEIAKFTDYNNQILEFALLFCGAMDKRLVSEIIPNVLLLRIGIVVFSDALLKAGLGNQFLQAIKQNNSENIAEIEKEFFGIDNNVFLTHILKQWKFGDKIVGISKHLKMPQASPKEIRRLSFIVSAIDKLYTLHYELDLKSILKASECLDLAIKFGENIDKGIFFEKLPQIAKNRIEQYLNR